MTTTTLRTRPVFVTVFWGGPFDRKQRQHTYKSWDEFAEKREALQTWVAAHDGHMQVVHAGNQTKSDCE